MYHLVHDYDYDDYDNYNDYNNYNDYGYIKKYTKYAKNKCEDNEEFNLLTATTACAHACTSSII